MPRFRRLARWSLILVAAFAGIILVMLLILQTGWAKNRLRQIAEERAEAALGADVSIGSLGGSLLFGAELRNVRIAVEDQPMAEIPEADVSYSLIDLLTGELDISSVALRRPVIHLRRTADGELNVAALGGAASEPPGTAPGARLVPGSQPVPPQAPFETVPARAGRGWAIGEILIEDGVVTIGDEVVTAEAVNAPERLTGIDGELAISSRVEGGVLLVIEALQFQTVAPALTVQRAEGALVFSSDLLRFDEFVLQTSAGVITADGAIRDRETTPVYDLRIAARDLEFPELAPLVPALDAYALSPTLEARLQGPLTALQTTFDVQMQAGGLSGTVTLDATAPERAIEGTIRTQNLNLAQLNLGEATELSLTAQLDLTLPEGGLSAIRGTYDVTAPEFEYGKYNAQNLQARGRIEGGRIQVDADADIYGGTLQTQGSIVLPSNGQPIEYNLKGKLRNVDPAQLPKDLRPPGVTGTRKSGGGGGTELPQRVRMDHGYADVPLRAVMTDGIAAAPAVLAAARQDQDQGIDLDFEIRGRGEDIEADVQLRDFALAGANFGQDTTVQVSRQAGRLQYAAEGRVRSLSLRQLGQELGFEALTAERYASDINAAFDISGSGTSLADLTLRGSAVLTDSELFGATFPRLVVKPNLTRGSGNVALEGRFDGLDLAAVTGNPNLESRLQGVLDVRAQLDNLADPDFSLGALDARGRLVLDDSVVAGIPIDKAVVDANISEARALIDELLITGPDLNVEVAGTLALDDTGASDLKYLIDTPALQRFEALGVPARGDVLLQGTVAGNFGRLVVRGTLSGTHVAYATTSALSIHSEYNVVVPGLSLAGANIEAVTELAEVDAAGRSFASVAARTDYTDKTLDFDATIKDPAGTLDIAGLLGFRPEGQQLRIRDLRFETPDSVWSLAAEQPVVVDYSGEALAIENFVLASTGGGRIAVDGALGAEEKVLVAAIDNLALDQIDDMILEEPLSGTLNATAQVRGSFSDPIVDAKFALAKGAFRGFEYQLASGTVEYTPALVRLDVKVDQSDGVALTAEGVVPLSTAAGEALRVAVRTTPIDLSLVQAFTDELREVNGTAEVDLTVLGSLAHPLVEGAVRVRDGAFTVVLAQSRYTGFDTDVIFEGESLTVRDFNLLDDEGNLLRIGGRLALNGERIQGVNILIQSDNFELADNRLAELNADTKLLIAGELLRPRIEGTIGLRESLIRVDRILQLTTGAYDVAAEEPESVEPGVFAPTIDVRLVIPDALVLRGTDLRAPGGATVGLGNVNITIGGDLQILKEPGQDIRLLGELQTIRGNYEFQGRQFAIQRDGRVIFLGTPEMNPRLDIRAQRDISGVVASVRIGGTLEAPELELSSQPPLDDAEILSLIVFNQPLSLLGTGAQISLATRATALATGFLASQLTESLSEVLELDLLEIETSSQAGALSPVLTLGEQIGELYVRLRQRFGPEAVSEAILEYRLAEWLRLQTSYAVGDAGARNLLQRVEAGGLDLLFHFSY